MIITLCGSTKFKSRFMEIKKEFESKGIIVEMPPIFSKADGVILTKIDAHKLECLQYEKIRISDSIYVVNCGEYIGEHTKKEIDLAKHLGVGIFYDE
mgnify:FL=1